MTRHTYFSLAIIFFCSITFSQEHRLEDKIMLCLYNSYGNNATEFRQTLLNYEELLIDENILKSNSPESYWKLWQSILKDNGINKKPSVFINSKHNALGQANIEQSLACFNRALEDSMLYKSSKIKRLSMSIENIATSTDSLPSNLAHAMLTNLDIDDYEHDYYKFQTFQSLRIIAFNREIEKQLKFADNQNKDVDAGSALRIHINNSDQLFINDQKVTWQEFSKTIKTYVIDYKSKSVFILTNDREATYKKYVEVQDSISKIIDEIRDQEALNSFNNTFLKLDSKEQHLIKEEYPIKIIEQY